MKRLVGDFETIAWKEPHACKLNSTFTQEASPFVFETEKIEKNKIGYTGEGFLGSLSTVEGSPGPVNLKVISNNPTVPEAHAIMVDNIVTNQDGKWKVSNLTMGYRYDVIASLPGYRDVIINNVLPSWEKPHFEPKTSYSSGMAFTLPIEFSTSSFSGGSYVDITQGVVFKFNSTKIQGTNSNMHLYIDLSTITSSKFWNDINVDGSNLRIYSLDTRTELPREVVWVDRVTKTGEVHVLFSETFSPTSKDGLLLSLSDTTVLDTDPTGKNNVWNDYIVAWHMNDATDSVGNVFSLTGDAVLSTSETKIGKSLYAKNGNANVSGLVKPLRENYQVELWYYNQGFNQNWGRYFDYSASNTYYKAAFTIHSNEYNYIRCDSRTNSGTYNLVFLDRTYAASQEWHKIILSFTYPDVYRVYLDGSLLTTTTNSFYSGKDVNFEQLFLNSNTEGTEKNDAYYSDIQIKKTSNELTDDHVKTKYNNQNDPSTFFDITDYISGL